MQCLKVWLMGAVLFFSAQSAYGCGSPRCICPWSETIEEMGYHPGPCAKCTLQGLDGCAWAVGFPTLLPCSLCCTSLWDWWKSFVVSTGGRASHRESAAVVQTEQPTRIEQRRAASKPEEG